MEYYGARTHARTRVHASRELPRSAPVLFAALWCRARETRTPPQRLLPHTCVYTQPSKPQQKNLNNRKQTNAVVNAGWFEAPATQAYEFGLDSDDGSDFAVSFDGASWDIVAS